MDTFAQHWRASRWKVENRNWKLETGKWKLENGKWRIDTGKRKTGTWDPESGNCYASGFHARQRHINPDLSGGLYRLAVPVLQFPVSNFYFPVSIFQFPISNFQFLLVLKTMATILIVEDEAKMLRLLELNLADEGYTTLAAPDAETALKLLRQEKVDLVLTDLKLPRMDGLEFLQNVKRSNTHLPVILMTAYGTVETAINAMKAGASDYVLKPFSMEEIKLLIGKELDVRRLREENRDLREALGERYRFENIVAKSAKLQEVLALVERVAPTNSTVLLGGESGVGKDMIARAIHQHSRRASGPFIKINCTAIPENLLESELFGYERGAFTGAVTSKPGKFELADKGTILLDEIGDVPGAIQVKLLRVLQEREFERLGGTKTLKVDVRVLAATNQDLRAALEQGTFREDLYYRLNVVPISIPPLREHKEDIPYLADHFLARFARESAKPIKGITPAAMRMLMDFHWPGNIRELENIIERAVALSTGTMLDVGDIRLDFGRGAPAIAGPGMLSGDAAGPFLPQGMTLEQYEDEIIKEALRRANGNKSQAARLLGLSRNAFRYRLSKLGVPDEQES
jgi:DNA-binding NtrC family response regulator